jgi:hypothetical protein
MDMVEFVGISGLPSIVQLTPELKNVLYAWASRAYRYAPEFPTIQRDPAPEEISYEALPFWCARPGEAGRRRRPRPDP